MASKRYAQVSKNCVACGTCVKACPLSVITIWRGVIAQVDSAKCVGCGKCMRECPAGVIALIDREVAV